nr:immunoglobulin heavy chain junction region [Macaca mulatta]MOV55338.1 immunoglobulin heavy chain junction region [Macaca mulatta]MOV55561.1 immunoglobulin heavy chain junction region [Macaca mulatta]MOV55802.1 immunoglobulin heavy chain junction region [Macaca mulatta]MOV56237.1 immunoglobulin heavy chain junction region [Macaca mulatta]
CARGAVVSATAMEQAILEYW